MTQLDITVTLQYVNRISALSQCTLFLWNVECC